MSDADEGDGPDRRVLALGLATFAVITGNYAFVGVLGSLAGGLGVSVGLAGQLVTVFALTNAVGAPLLVALTARVERRRLLTFALLVYAAATAVVAILPDFGTVLASRVLAAVAAAIFTPVAAAVATGFVPAGREGRALALVNGGLTLAFVAGIPVGTVVGGLFGWRATFLLGGALTLLALLVLRVALPTVEGGGTTGGASTFSLLRDRGVAFDVGVTALGFTTVFVVQAFVGPVLAGMTGFGEGGVGALQVVLGVSGLAGALAAGRGADERDTGDLLVLVFLVLTVSVLPFSLFAGAGGGTPAVAGAVVAMVLGGCSLFALVPLQQYRLVQRWPDRRNVVLALNASALFLGQAAGGAIGGLTATYASTAALGWVGAAVGLVGLAAALAGRGITVPAAEPVPE
jgi:DHA1 family purine base/nucleoside efflux pump-like MFS transporter